MEDTVSVEGERHFAPAKTRHGPSAANILSFVVGLVGVAALGATAFVYAETQREIVRLSTDIAQIRLSLELYGRMQGNPSSTDSASLLDLANRLAILEQDWRSAPAADAGTPTLPAIATPAPPSAASDGDCLPTGTRFLVAAGDSYPICGIAGSVEIGAVDNGFISLGDGTVIASGGNIALAGTACMIGVVSAGEDGMTGYAEVR